MAYAFHACLTIVRDLEQHLPFKHVLLFISFNCRLIDGSRFEGYSVIGRYRLEFTIVFATFSRCVPPCRRLIP